MLTIHKHIIPLKSEKFSLLISEGSQVLKLDWQNNDICLWVLTDPTLTAVQRNFVFHGTGHKVQTHEDHVGSFMNGPYMMHLFQVIQ